MKVEKNIEAINNLLSILSIAPTRLSDEQLIEYKVQEQIKKLMFLKMILSNEKRNIGKK